MALTRKMLKAMGIEDEKIDQIIEAHGETVDALKEQREQYKADADKLPEVQKQLDTAREQMENAGKDPWKDKYDELKGDYDKYKADQDAKDTHRAKEAAYREVLKAAGIPDKRIAGIIKVSAEAIDALDLDDEGNAKDADKLVAAVKSEWEDFIPTTTEGGAPRHNPPANTNGGMTKEDIYKKDDHGRYVLSAAERQRAIAENPELFGI